MPGLPVGRRSTVTAVDAGRGTATVLGASRRAGGSAPVGARPAADGTGPDTECAEPGGSRGSRPTVASAWSGGPADGLEARSAPGEQRTDPTDSVWVADAAGWAPVGDGVTWRHDLVEAAVRVAGASDDDGAALYARMTAPDRADLGRPSVEHLPAGPDDAGLDDAVLVVRRQLVEGTLSMRVDLVRNAPDLQVVVSARLPDPARADAAVVALVQLLAAVGADDDHGRLAG